MGLFNLLKKSKNESIASKPLKEKSMKTDITNSFGEPIDKLVNGNLPWGWTAHNQDFTDKIRTEYSFFLKQWVDCRNKSPKELYFALKSFVKYIEDAETLCKSKGECFEFWFHEILVGKDYLNIRKNELEILTQNLSELQNEYECRQKALSDLESALLKSLKQNTGILQKDVYKLFDSSVKQDIQSLLYQWAKSGKIKREKIGNTYKIIVL